MTKTEKPAPSSGKGVKGGSNKRYFAQASASIAANKARRKTRTEKRRQRDIDRVLTMRVPRGTAREKRRAAWNNVCPLGGREDGSIGRKMTFAEWSRSS